MSLERVDVPQIPRRDPNGHKGTFGTVGVIGGLTGTKVMIGGPAFSALGALRSGCGLAVIAAPEQILHDVLRVAPEATGVALAVKSDGELIASAAAETIDNHLSAARVLVVGPGFGDGEPQRQIVMRLVSRDEQPLVLDADALNVLARTTELQVDFRAPAILTPHPGEFARLAGSLGITTTPSNEEERVAAAAELAGRLGAIVVLKGPGTVVTDGLRAYVNTTGNVALATGGSGDVLSGLCAGFVSQFLGERDLFECACLAAWVHGKAADDVVHERHDSRMIARELLDAIPAAIAESVSDQ